MSKYLLAAVMFLVLTVTAFAGVQLGANTDGTLNNNDGSYITDYHVQGDGVLRVMVGGSWYSFNWCTTHERYESFDLGIWIAFTAIPPPLVDVFDYTFTSDGAITTGKVDKQS
jgi:hypothetical protein